jgi:hypothetical protein
MVARWRSRFRQFAQKSFPFRSVSARVLEKCTTQRGSGEGVAVGAGNGGILAGEGEWDLQVGVVTVEERDEILASDLEQGRLDRGRGRR